MARPGGAACWLLQLLLVILLLGSNSDVAVAQEHQEEHQEERKEERKVAGIDTVRVVFMNHLDIGFDGIDPTVGFAVNVIAKYFQVYFPLAIDTAQKMREREQRERPYMDAPGAQSAQGGDRFIYTTDAWLVDLYSDPRCEERNAHGHFIPGVAVDQWQPGNKTVLRVKCPSPQERQRFRDAVVRGDIAWHAFPFNAEAELADPSLYAASVAMCQRLQERFFHDEHRPVISTVSQRDVPGLTRAAIPVLRSRGVRAISVGVNGASAPPAVPKAFVWRDEAGSGEELLAMWHPGGYGGIAVSDCVIVDGLSTALAFAFRGDNKGPQTVAEVLEVYASIREEFGSGTRVVASTFDEFVDELEGVRDKLAVVTGEIGDTWIYGAASDPLKVAMLRSAMRLRAACVRRGDEGCRSGSEPFANFDFLLMKAIEHTWGLDVKTFLHDWTNWTNIQFMRAESGSNYGLMRASWEEQRAYLTNAVAQMKGHQLARDIEAEWATLRDVRAPTPSGLSEEGYVRVAGWTPSHVFSCSKTAVSWQLDTSGAASMLDIHGVSLASSSRRLGLFSYQTYDQADYDTFLGEYMYCPSCVWAGKDFGKPNVSSAHPTHATVHPTVDSVYWRAGDCSAMVQMNMADDAHKQAGAPRQLWVKWRADEGSDATRLLIDLRWIDKTATRLPEAIFFGFNPLPQSGWQWSMDKMGSMVDPLQVVVNGSHHIHGVQRGVRFGPASSGRSVWFETVDAALAIPGKPSGFPTPLKGSPDVGSFGVSYMLEDNLWGTNYIMWYPWKAEDSNSLFRFAVALETQH